ncbi:MAG: sigma-70 family RNA polymerase sigma factor [Alphaproteobacteria bacterium]|nr:sigma-70 family RNA polymerase sigma factor [Alphaproteobacteria bacterium]
MPGKDLRSDISGHVDQLRRYALVLTRNPDAAADLVQETLLRAIAAADTFQPGSDLRKWLFAILDNNWVSDRRRAAVRIAGDALAQPSPVEPAGQADHVFLTQTLAALARLPDDQRAAVVLVAVYGIGYRDAADILGIPVGTLMSRLARGR